MLANLFDVLFGCAHKNYSFPITVKSRRRGAAAPTGTYVVCLDCGKEFPYDWAEMRLMSAAQLTPSRVTEPDSPAASEAA